MWTDTLYNLHPNQLLVPLFVLTTCNDLYRPMNPLVLFQAPLATYFGYLSNKHMAAVPAGWP